MKKRILTMLLSALLAANLNACAFVPINEAANRTNQTATSETKYTETLDSNHTQSSPSESESDNETVRDVPGLGQLKLRSSRNLTTASIWKDQEGEFYIYFNEWDAYRHLRGLSPYHSPYFSPYWYESDNSIVVDGETATVSIINQDGKHDEPTILTYHFNRNNNLVELHAVQLNIIASSEYDTFFVNMHDSDHGYYFLTPSMDGNQDWRMDGVRGWPLFMFETTDGGKSWNQISTKILDPQSSDHIYIFKFVSPQVGIISFRYIEVEDLCDRTYLTLDCGLTWTQLSQLPYPFDLNKPRTWYSEIIDFDQNDDRYYLTVEVHGTLEAVEGSDCAFPSEPTKIRFSFESKDLINWSLIED